MIAQSIGHSTGDEGIALAMNLCEEGGRGAYHLVRFLMRREKEQRTLAKNTVDPVISDACSAYRGGYTGTASPEVKTLLSDLVGKESFQNLSEKPFAFLGNDSDLAYFWRKTSRNTPVMLNRATVDGIEDPALRAKVTSVLARARADGTLAMRGENYLLTPEGERRILRSDFIQDRLRAECRYYGIAHGALGEEQEKRAMDKIDRKLRELGKSGEFQGCDRIVLKKNRLFAGEKEDVYRFYLPGSGRKKVVELPKEDVIALDEKTFAAFLRPGTKYSLNGEDAEEKDIFKHFWNQNKEESERITHAADKGAEEFPTAEAEEQPPEEWMQDWEAELSPTEKPEKTILRPPMRSSVAETGGSAPGLGDSCYVLSGAGEELAPKPCTVEAIFPAPDGNDLYRLRSVGESSEGRMALLLQKEDVGRILFLKKEDAALYTALFPEDAQKSAELLDKISPAEGKKPIEPTELAVNPTYVTVKEREEIGYIRIGGREFEQLEVPKSALQIEKKGNVLLRLQPEQIYTVRTGNVSYEVSGKGAEKLLESTKTLVKTAVKQTATETAKTVASTAAAVGATAATAGLAAPISAAAKLIETTVTNATKLGADGRGLMQGLHR